MKMSDSESFSIEGEVLSEAEYNGEVSDYRKIESSDNYGEESEEEAEGEPKEVNFELDEDADSGSSEEEKDESDGKDKKDELYLSEHLPGLLSAIKKCEQEAGEKSLDFEDERLSAYHLQIIFDFLETSQITELSVESNDLKSGMPFVVEKLNKTRLSKLNVAHCDLDISDVLCLTRVLEHTHISDLNTSRVFAECTEQWAEEFVSYLIKFRLVSLTMRVCHFFTNAGAICFVDSLLSTKITRLDISGSLHDSAGLIFLFAILPNTSIMELIVNNNRITDIELKALSQTLRKSKLERLDLGSNLIRDASVNVLVNNLISSKVINPSLSDNKFSSNNNIAHHLKDTSIKILNLGLNKDIGAIFSSPDFLSSSSVSALLLSCCQLSDEVGENLMRSLKYSEVMELNLELNNFGLQTVTEFANVLQDSNIIDVNFSGNCIPSEGFYILGECLKNSKVQRVSVSRNAEILSGVTDFALFIEKTKCSKISYLDISGNPFRSDGMEIISKSLVNATFTHLNLSHCSIGDGILSLVTCLKYTAVTHLKLGNTKIRDKGAEALAACLAETQINTLDVSKNSITNGGAKYLASRLKDTSLYVLKLWGNEVDNKGIEDLAKIIEGTFVTDFDIKFYQIRKYFTIDTDLWKNRMSVHKLLKFFKKIAPKTIDNSFQFDGNLNHADCISGFLDKCLHFHKIIIEHPSAISAIVQDETLSLSRKQVTKLLLEDFPFQLTSFIGSRIEADVSQHICFIEKAEAMGLNNIQVVPPVTLSCLNFLFFVFFFILFLYLCQ